MPRAYNRSFSCTFCVSACACMAGVPLFWLSNLSTKDRGPPKKNNKNTSLLKFILAVEF